MPKAYLSEGEPEREPGQIALQVCRLSACARAFVCVRVIAGHVCEVGRVPSRNLPTHLVCSDV